MGSIFTTQKECNLNIEYKYAHKECISQACSSFQFGILNCKCMICGGLMRKLPHKKLYCPECANNNELCPFTICPKN